MDKATDMLIEAAEFLKAVAAGHPSQAVADECFAHAHKLEELARRDGFESVEARALRAGDVVLYHGERRIESLKNDEFVTMDFGDHYEWTVSPDYLVARKVRP